MKMTTINVQKEQLEEFKRQKLKHMTQFGKTSMSDWEFMEFILSKNKETPMATYTPKVI